MIFSKSIIANSINNANAQIRERDDIRLAFARNEANFERINGNAGRVDRLAVNQGIIPQDVYQEFDNTTVTRMRSDDGDTFLNDLMPLSKSVNIGKLVHKYRRASDAGIVVTSMGGQIGSLADQVQYSIDGSIIPIKQSAFKRGFREWNAGRPENWDALNDDQRETVATVRANIADSFLDGMTDQQGNAIVEDGLSWLGMRADGRVLQVDLGVGDVNFDFTDTSKTYEEIEAAFKIVRDKLWIDNNCEKPVVYYISRQIASNLERNSSEFANSENKILQRLAGLQGVSAIKVSNKLVDNEMMALPLDGAVRPVVGMAMNTIALPRTKWNDDYTFDVVYAGGWEVRTDHFNNTCAMFASS